MAPRSTPCPDGASARGEHLPPRRPLRVTVVQVAAGRQTPSNLLRIDKLSAGTGPEDLLALPEVFAFRDDDRGYRERAEPIPGPLSKRLADLARRRNAWILGGSIIENDNGRIFNTCILLDRAGRIAARYRKMHLFEAALEDGRVIREADAYQAGDTPVLAEIEGWVCGLSICYDIRFPELYRCYAGGGAHILFMPANFTQRTGKDHWEILVRARAIENQCFVIAPDQCGRNEVTGIASHGHSMAVGPWGAVLAQARRAETAFTVTLQPADLTATRRRIPALAHRRLPPAPGLKK